MYPKRLPVIFHFYKRFAPATIILSSVIWFLVHSEGRSIIKPLCYFKIITDLLIYAGVKAFGGKNLYYYYYNLQISKALLWGMALFIDTIIFITGLYLVQ